MGTIENDILLRIQECTQVLSEEEISLVSKYIRMQIPKEPRIVEATCGRTAQCPSCDRWIRVHPNFKPSVNRYCPKCGQKMDWTLNIISRMEEAGLVKELNHEQG